MNQKIFPDCLIFDVDGVLMEALASFPEMIRIVFEEEWRRAGNVCDAPGYTLRLPAVGDALRPRLDALQPALAGKTLRACG